MPSLLDLPRELRDMTYSDVLSARESLRLYYDLLCALTYHPYCTFNPIVTQVLRSRAKPEHNCDMVHYYFVPRSSIPYRTKLPKVNQQLHYDVVDYLRHHGNLGISLFPCLAKLKELDPVLRVWT